MTAYAFSPAPDETDASWSDPSVWSGGVVPNGPDAAVVLPLITGGIYPVTIAAGDAYEVSSLDSDGGYLTLDGTLNVDGGVSLEGGGQIGLDGGELNTGAGLTIADGELSGYGLVTGPVVDDGIINVSPVDTGYAVMVIDGAVSGDGGLTLGTGAALASGYNYALELGAAASVGVAFGSLGGVLALDDPQDFTGTISPFAAPYGPLENASSDVLGSPAVAYDEVALVGLSLADVTTFTYGGDAEGGVVTVVGDGKTVTLNVAGDFSTANFGIYAGPDTTDGQSSVLLDITPALIAPTVALSLADGTNSSYAITNTGALLLDGTVPADANVQLTIDGTASGDASSLVVSGEDPNVARPYTDPLATPLAPGAHDIVATASGFYASATSDPLDLFVLPDPVGGITTAAVGSFQFGALLDAGYSMNFVTGTEAIVLTDGTLSVGADTVEASVQRLYEGLLGRAADPGGLAHFTALASAAGTASVADAILGSPEFIGLHGTLASLGNTAFVTLLYNELLGRAPDAGGLASHVSALQGGASGASLAAGIADSGEAKAHLASTTGNLWVPNPTGATVTELYETAFGQAPDLGGLALFSNALQGGLGVQQLAADLAASPEFLADHAGQGGAALVTSLYESGLGRAPSAADLQYWSGASAANVLLGVAASPEAAVHLIRNV